MLQAGDGSAVTPIPRNDGWWMKRHAQINSVVEAAGENAQVIFVGDSITQGWEGAGAKVWENHIKQFGAINLGIGGDRTEHVLWRFDHGNVKDIAPRVAVIMIGTNNFGYQQDSTEEVLDGVVAVVEKLQRNVSGVHVVLLDIFPRGEVFNEMRGNILQVNQSLQAAYADDSRVTFLPIGHLFIESDGSISKEIMPDYLHLSEEGYQRWADAIVPTVENLLNRRVPSSQQ
jgi:beta-glucosidase